MLSQGIQHDFSSDEDPPVSIEDMNRILDAEGAELQKQFEAEGNPDPYNAALEALRQKYQL